MADSPSPVRVVMQQPALAKYRVPVFQELAARSGLRFHLFYDKRPGLPNVEPAGFRAEFVPSRRLFKGLFWHSPQWCQATRRHCDVLILSWDLHGLSLIPALWRARFNRVATVLWGHGYSKNESSRRRFWREWAGRQATSLLLYNHTTARDLQERGFDPRRVFVALNAIDQAPIQAARQKWLESPSAMRQFQQENKLHGPVVLFVSRLEPSNRVDLLLEALPSLQREFPDLTVAIIGKGDITALQEQARRLGIVETVRFLGAIYEEEKLAPWFLSAGVFCYPANIGLSLLHAFGYGLPVVTGDKIEAQNPEIEALRPGENGLLYCDGDAGDLSRALGELLRDEPRRQQMAKVARQTVLDGFSLENMVDGMEAAIRGSAAQVITRPSRKRMAR